MRPLSHQQKQILRHIFAKTQEADLAAEGQGAVSWGVDGDRVFQASASRALKRLECRGLLRRLHHTAPGQEPSPEPHHRTTHVVLTDVGIATAQRLTASSVTGC